GQVGAASLLGEVAHAGQVGGPLRVEIATRRPTRQQRQHDLGEHHRLEVGLGRLGLRQPRLEPAYAGARNGVALALGPAARFYASHLHLPVALQAPQSGVHLAEWHGPVGSEAVVVGPLELVAVDRLPLQKAQQRVGDGHRSDYTSSEYTEGIAR